MQKKNFDKIQHPFMIKIVKEQDIELTYLNIIKATNDKPTSNIILNNKNLKSFPLRSVKRQKAHSCHLYST